MKTKEFFFIEIESIRILPTNKKVNKISFCSLLVKNTLRLYTHNQTQRILNTAIRPIDVKGTIKGVCKSNHPLDIISIENCSKGSI